ncbi:MAG: DUF2490 domain-containing protein [Bacteroidetes bacterium]|nr:DUF2490 domain-containing protein [Bacteroidota bacterium]
MITRDYLKPNTIVKIVLFFLVSVYFSNKSFPQELWTGGTIEINIKKKFSLELEPQLRLADGLTSYNGYYCEAGFGFEINKHLKVKGSYRYTDKAGHHDSEIRPSNNRERFSGDLYIKIGKKFPVKYRIKYQYTKERNTHIEYNYIRNKITVNYQLHDLAKPFTSGEFFYRLDKKNELRAFRFTIGLDSKISKEISAKNFFKVEKEMNVKYPQKYYIYGIMFTYKFN